jgi:type II secretory pathway predicted ATPase ExeA
MSIERLRAHYGFTKMPFGKDVAPGALHRSASQQEAVARIGFLIAESQAGVVTGEVGAGKTVALRAAISALDGSRHTVIYLANPTVGVRGLHAAIVTALGGVARFHAAALVPQTEELLATEAAERGKKVVLCVDEAHLLSTEQLESLRLLMNQELDSVSPFALVLCGQPTLRRRIRLGTFAALEQRIALRYHIQGMTDAETGAYIAHHLTLAGRSDTLFSDDAVALVHQVARGLPRAVNNLAVQSLVAAYAEKKAIVDESSARMAITEITGD